VIIKHELENPRFNWGESEPQKQKPKPSSPYRAQFGTHNVVTSYRALLGKPMAF